MWPLYPVRQDIIEANGDGWTEAGTHISNGAFKLETWDHNENISLVRNDEWHRDPVMLDRLNMDMIEDTAIAFLAYQEGELDMITLGPAELVQVRGTDFEDEFHSYAQLVTIGIYFNNDDPSFADKMVRQAFAGALDRDESASASKGRHLRRWPDPLPARRGGGGGGGESPQPPAATPPR